MTPLLASFVMFMAVYIFVNSVSLSPLLSLMLAVIIGGAIYLTLNIPILSGLFKRIFGKYLFREAENEQDRID